MTDGARRATALLLLVVSCARQRREAPAPEAAATGELRVQARGPVTALAVTAGTLSFCDGAGLHRFALPGGHEEGAPLPCPATGLVAGPGGPEVTVRNPDHGPHDILEIAGVATSFPIAGHAQDWAISASGRGGGQVVMVGTATQVLRIDPAANRVTTLSSTGAERVATDGSWAAWVVGTAIVARSL